MPYAGPSRRYDVPAASTFDRVMALGGRTNGYGGSPGAGASYGAGARGIDTDLIQMQAREEAEQARLAMAPGVTRGGSTATISDPTSPLNRSASRQFTSGGQSYSFDPTSAAETEGRSAATAQTEADKVRHQALLNTPGITPRQATRLVYGRGDILDSDPTEIRDALAAFTRQPTREGAARAVERGANPNQFPDRFTEVRRGRNGFELPQQPMRGDPEYFDTLRQEEAIRTQGTMDEIRLRSELAPPPRARIKEVQAPDGTIGTQNLDTGEIQWSDQKGKMGGGGGAMAFLQKHGLGDGSAPSAAAPARPSAGASALREEAFRLLQGQGIDDPTPEQMQEAMNRISTQRQSRRGRGGN